MYDNIEENEENVTTEENDKKDDYELIYIKLNEVESVTFDSISMRESKQVRIFKESKDDVLTDAVILLYNNIYKIPVNVDLNSDNYKNIRILSNIADRIDVKYIQDGYACVTPIQHGIKIFDKELLCVLY